MSNHHQFGVGTSVIGVAQGASANQTKVSIGSVHGAEVSRVLKTITPARDDDGIRPIVRGVRVEIGTESTTPKTKIVLGLSDYPIESLDARPKTQVVIEPIDSVVKEIESPWIQDTDSPKDEV